MEKIKFGKGIIGILLLIIVLTSILPSDVSADITAIEEGETLYEESQEVLCETANQDQLPCEESGENTEICYYYFELSECDTVKIAVSVEGGVDLQERTVTLLSPEQVEYSALTINKTATFDIQTPASGVWKAYSDDNATLSVTINPNYENEGSLPLDASQSDLNNIISGSEEGLESSVALLNPEVVQPNITGPKIVTIEDVNATGAIHYSVCKSAGSISSNSTEANGYYASPTKLVWSNVPYWKPEAVFVGFAKQAGATTILPGQVGIDVTKEHGHEYSNAGATVAWYGYANNVTRVSGSFSNITTGPNRSSGSFADITEGKNATWTYTGNIPAGATYVYIAGVDASGSNDYLYAYHSISSFKTDSTDPSINASPNGITAVGVNGTTFYKNYVAVDFTVADSESKPGQLLTKNNSSGWTTTSIATTSSSASRSLNFSSPGINNIYYYAKDGVGNACAQKSSTFYVDNDNPSASFSAVGTNAAKSDTVTLYYSDNTSGITGYAVTNSTTDPSYYTPIAADNNGSINYTFTTLGTYYLHVRDAVGHTAMSGAINVSNIDKLAPNATYNITGTKFGSWYKDSALITVTGTDANATATDGKSGIKNVIINGSSYSGASKGINATSGTKSYSYYVTDNAGNISPTGSVSVSVDNSKPANVSLNNSTPNWSTSSNLAAKASDTYSGLASIVLYKKALDGSWTNIATKTYGGQTDTQSTSFSINQNGTYKTIAYDGVQHETLSNEIVVDNIDTVGPTIEGVVEGDYHPDINWYKGNATLKLIAIDADGDVNNGKSDIESITLTANGVVGKQSVKSLDIPVTNPGTNTYSYYTTDNALNTSPMLQSIIKIDNSAPEALTTTPSTTEWQSGYLTITGTAKDTLSGLQNTTLLYSEDGTNWAPYVYTNFGEDPTVEANDYLKLNPKPYKGETDLQTFQYAITKNGYYKLEVDDRVGYITDSTDVLHITNIDNADPSEAAMGITPDTTEWVNEATGVNVTSFGSDSESGLDTVAVMHWDEAAHDYLDIKAQQFNGEHSVESTTYQTHDNGSFKTKVIDKAGNDTAMPDDKALPVENIDPVAPDVEITTATDTQAWSRVADGFTILGTLKDNESGLGEVKLQKLITSDNGDGTTTDNWVDTGIDYEIVSADQSGSDEDSSEENPSSESQDKGVIKAIKDTIDNLKGLFDKAKEDELSLLPHQVDTVYASEVPTTGSSELNTDSSSEDSGSDSDFDTDESIKGTNKTVKVAFTVTENGTYRLVGADVVENTTVTKDTISVTKMDGSKPTIDVKGNPTVWTNQSATLTVTAKDTDSAIAKMTLDGKEMEIKQNDDGSASFTFIADKNADFTMTATDSAGNVTSDNVSVTKIDKEAPVVKATLDTTKGWTDGGRDLDFTVMDGQSGINAISVNEDTVLDHKGDAGVAESTLTYNCRINANGDYKVLAKDIAGNEGIATVTETEGKVLKAIEVVVPPEKTAYYEKEDFNQAGMVVDAIYNDNSRRQNISDYVIANGSALKTSQTKVDLSYSENGKTVCADTPVSVSLKGEDSVTPVDPVIPDKPVPDKPVPDDPNDPDIPDSSDTPVPKKPVRPSKPDTPINPDTPETPEPKIEKKPVKNTVNTPEQAYETPKEKGLPAYLIPVVSAGTGLFLIALFLILSNVTIYTMNEKGRYKLIGKTRAKRRDIDHYEVKVGNIMLKLAESGTFKIVFARRFAKLHPDCNIDIRIGEELYQCHIEDGQREIILENVDIQD